jgi:capsular polysaccharide biosynthesis protein
MEEKEIFEETPRKENISSPGDVLRVIQRRLWTIIVPVVLVVMGSAVGYSLLQTPAYQASSLIVIGQETPDDAEAVPGRGIADSEVLVATAVRAIVTRPVAQAVVEKLNLPEEVPVVLANMNVEAEPGTMFIEVSYTATDPKRAQRVANAMDEVFSDQISELNVSATPLTAKVWEPATLPETPVSPRLLFNGALALVIGTILGIGLAFLFESLDDGQISPEDIPGKKSRSK